VAPVIAKLRQRFHLRRVVLVGDRGLLTDARIREALKPVEGLDWITARRYPTVRTPVDRGPLDLGCLAHTARIELTAAAYPDERLIACYNVTLADERGRKREALLQATERELEMLGQATTRAKRRLTGQGQMALRVGKVLNRFKMGKHFTLERYPASITASATWSRARHQTIISSIAFRVAPRELPRHPSPGIFTMTVA